MTRRDRTRPDKTRQEWTRTHRCALVFYVISAERLGYVGEKGRSLASETLERQCIL